MGIFDSLGVGVLQPPSMHCTVCLVGLLIKRKVQHDL